MHCNPSTNQSNAVLSKVKWINAWFYKTFGALYNEDYFSLSLWFSYILLHFNGTAREILSMQNLSLTLNIKNLSFQLTVVPCHFCAEGVTTTSPYGQSSSLTEIS